VTTDHLPLTVPAPIVRARRIALGLVVLAVLIVVAAVVLYAWWNTTRVPTVI
jgi:hypothetical protein